MAFVPFEKIISFLKFSAVYAADDTEISPDAPTFDATASADAENGAVETKTAPAERSTRIKSLDELFASETDSDETAESDTSGDTEIQDEVQEIEREESEPAAEEQSGELTPDTEIQDEVQETAREEAEQEPEEQADESVFDGRAEQPDEIPFDADKEQKKLHDRALRFANGRTGVLGLFRQFKEAILIAGAVAAKVFVSPKKTTPKTKTKFNVSKDVERAFSNDDEKASAAESEESGEPTVDIAPSDEQFDSAKDIETKKKPSRKPSAKAAKIVSGSAKSADDTKTGAPPLDKAAAKKEKEKEKAAAKKIKDAEKKAAKKAKDDAKKVEKQAKEEAKKAVKEAKEAAFAEKNPKKAAKRAEQSAKKEASKASKDAKKKVKPDKGVSKAAKAASRAAKKAKKEENKKPKLTKEEKFQLKLDKQAAKHEKRIARFEKKALRINQRLEKKQGKREVLQERKDERKSILKEQRRIRKERKRELKKQKKYWLERGVGRAGRNASIILLVVLIVAALSTGTTFLYKSDSVDIPILNKAVQTVADSPVMSVINFLDKPVHVAMEYAAIPVSYLIHVIQGEPKIEDMYFFEADKLERYDAFKETHPDMSSDEIVWRVNAGVDLNFYQDPVRILDFSKQPILINKFHTVRSEFVPDNMMPIPGSVLMQANTDAVEAFTRMKTDAAAENLNITVASAYRSFEYENLLYNPITSDTRQNPDSLLARPGFSENQTGLALDLSADGGRMYDFAGTPEADWVAKNAGNYGFILRYPDGQEDVTGFRYQPWHIRYVGDDVVKTMRENDIITLEEYCIKFVDHRPGDTPEKAERPADSSMTEGTDGPI
jgi:D-alanyl-D-alanine carboxypeptidase